MIKKIPAIYVITIIILAGLLIGVPRLIAINSPKSPQSTSPATGIPSPTLPVMSTETVLATVPTPTDLPNFKDATIVVDGNEVQLQDGVAEVPVAPDSTEKMNFSYFGNDAVGDLNGDGKDDVAFLLIKNGTGSGTFYYIVAALLTDKGYEGGNAILLGDRISPQNTSIENGKIIVNYMDRLPTEPFTTEPSWGVTKYLKIKGDLLVEFNPLSQITNREWKWEKTLMNDSSITMPRKTDSFTLLFKDDGNFSGTTDCNNYFGQYTVADNKLSFGSIAATEMACQDSQEGEFLKFLADVDNFLVDPLNNSLILLIKFDSGSMIFK